MDTICLANTCKGLRCTRSKINVNYCKIHTTNEICSICNSTQISTTDSILKRSGKSWCIDCRKINGDEAIARMREYAMQQEIEYEKQRLEQKNQLKQMLEDRRELLDNNYFIAFENIINQIYNTA